MFASKYLDKYKLFLQSNIYDKNTFILYSIICASILQIILTLFFGVFIVGFSDKWTFRYGYLNEMSTQMLLVNYLSCFFLGFFCTIFNAYLLKTQV